MTQPTHLLMLRSQVFEFDIAQSAEPVQPGSHWPDVMLQYWPIPQSSIAGSPEGMHSAHCPVVVLHSGPLGSFAQSAGPLQPVGPPADPPVPIIPAEPPTPVSPPVPIMPPVPPPTPLELLEVALPLPLDPVPPPPALHAAAMTSVVSPEIAKTDCTESMLWRLVRRTIPDTSHQRRGGTRPAQSKPRATRKSALPTTAKGALSRNGSLVDADRRGL